MRVCRCPEPPLIQVAQREAEGESSCLVSAQGCDVHLWRLGREASTQASKPAHYLLKGVYIALKLWISILRILILVKLGVLLLEVFSVRSRLTSIGSAALRLRLAWGQEAETSGRPWAREGASVDLLKAPQHIAHVHKTGAQYVRAVALSPDNRLLAFCDNTSVRCYEVHALRLPPKFVVLLVHSNPASS